MFQSQRNHSGRLDVGWASECGPVPGGQRLSLLISLRAHSGIWEGLELRVTTCSCISQWHQIAIKFGYDLDTNWQAFQSTQTLSGGATLGRLASCPKSQVIPVQNRA